MAITVKKIEADGFVIEMTADGVSVSVQVSVPKRQGDRIFSDAEREKIAKVEGHRRSFGLCRGPCRSRRR
jgi:hypothetical protein